MRILRAEHGDVRQVTTTEKPLALRDLLVNLRGELRRARQVAVP
jgi:hypothetical protein